MNEINVLTKYKEKLAGRVLNDNEINSLENKFSEDLYPKWLGKLLTSFEISGNSFSMSEENDLSGMGVEMKWLYPEEQLDESFNVYPGIVAIKFKYLPIGMCLEGSGDPYFIDLKNDASKIVRVPHDSIIDDNSLDESQIEIVSNSLADFFEVCMRGE